VSRNPDAQGWNNTYFHIAVSDDTTPINTFDDVALERGMTDAQDQDAGWSTRPLSEVGCYSNGAGDRYRKGKFRLAAAISRHARTIAIERVTCGVGATDYDYQITGRGGNAGALLVTRYGKGTVLDRHIEIVARTIPKTLEPGS
jgi:hypothetical protein